MRESLDLGHAYLYKSFFYVDYPNEWHSTGERYMTGVPAESPLALPGLIRLGATTAGPDGAVEGPIGLGVDLAAVIRDHRGALTFENHVVGSPARAFGPVPAIVRLLLLLAIPEYLATHVDRGWVEIRDDLIKLEPESLTDPPAAAAVAAAAAAPATVGLAVGALAPDVRRSPPAAFADLFKEGPGGGHEKWPPQPPKPPPPLPPFKPAEYVFTVVSMTITDTRSRHEDSDKAAVSVAVGSGAPQTVTRDLGNLNNGTFALGMSVGPFEVADPNAGVAANYLIVNSGHGDWNTVNGLLGKAGGALASAGAKAATDAVGSAIGASVGTGIMPVVGSVLGAIAGWIVGEVVGLLTADCDGPVAAEQPAFKGIELWNRTQTPSNSFSHETYHPGIDSPEGCGSNSQYYVSWSVTRVG